MPSNKVESKQVRENDAPKDARLELRSTASQKSVIEKAAALLGESVTSFVLSTVMGESLKVIREYSMTELSLRDWKRFNTVLTSDAGPNEQLSEAHEQYKERVSA